MSVHVGPAAFGAPTASLRHGRRPTPEPATATRDAARTRGTMPGSNPAAPTHPSLVVRISSACPCARRRHCELGAPRRSEFVWHPSLDMQHADYRARLESQRVSVLPPLEPATFLDTALVSI